MPCSCADVSGRAICSWKSSAREEREGRRHQSSPLGISDSCSSRWRAPCHMIACRITGCMDLHVSQACCPCNSSSRSPASSLTPFAPASVYTSTAAAASDGKQTAPSAQVCPSRPCSRVNSCVLPDQILVQSDRLQELGQCCSHSLSNMG